MLYCFLPNAFAGIVCTCGVRFHLRETGDRGGGAKQLTKHKNRVQSSGVPHDAFPATTEETSATHRVIRDRLDGIAESLAACRSDEKAIACILEMSLEAGVCEGWYCSKCNKAFTRKDNHVKCDDGSPVKSECFTKRSDLRKVRHAKERPLLVLPTLECISPYVAQKMNEIVARIPSITDEAQKQFALDESSFLNKDLRFPVERHEPEPVKGPLPHIAIVRDPAIFEATVPSDDKKLPTKRMLYEVDGMIQDSSSRIVVNEFADYLGIYDLLSTTYNDNQKEMTETLCSLLKEPELGTYEMPLYKAAGRLFEKSIDNLRKINVLARSSIQSIAPSYSNATALNKVRALVESYTNEGEGDDDDDDDGGDYLDGAASLDFHEVNAMLADIEDAVQPYQYSRGLSDLSKESRLRYKKNMQQLVLFVSRYIRESQKKEWDWLGKDLALNEATESEQFEVFALRVMLIISLNSPRDVVGTEIDLTHLFVIAKSLHHNANDSEATSWILSLVSLDRARHCISQTLHNMRSTYLMPLLQAEQERNKTLQGLVQNPRKLGSGHSSMNLIMLASKIKKLQRRIRKPGCVAQKSSSSMDGVIDTWTIVRPIGVTLTLTGMINGIWTLISNVQNQMTNTLRLCLANRIVNRGALKYVSLIDPVQTTDLFLSIIGDECHPVTYKPLDCNTVYRSGSKSVATVGTHHNADGFVFDGDEIAGILVEILLNDEEIRAQFDEACDDIMTDLGALLTMTLRGSPRIQDLIKWICGASNNHSVSSKEASLSQLATGGMHNICDQLYVYFTSCKFRGFAQDVRGRDSDYLKVPKEVGVLLAVFLSVFRAAGMKTYYKLTKDENGMMLGLTRFFVDSRTDITKGQYHERKTDLEALKNAIARRREDVLNVPTWTMGHRVYRQLHCSMIETIHVDSVVIRLASGLASAFGHKKPTHEREYSEKSPDMGQHCHPESITSNTIFVQNLSLDDKTHLYWGFASSVHVEQVPARTLIPERVSNSRCLRLPTDSQSLGLLKLICAIDYEERAPSQRHLLTEAISASRDSLHTYPCGEGKSIILFGGPAYGLACYHIRQAQTNVQGYQSDSFYTVLAEELCSWTTQNGKTPNTEKIKNTVSDPLVQDFIQFAESDSCPLSADSVSIVVAPTIPLANSLVRDMSKCNLVFARRWTSDNHSEVCKALERRFGARQQDPTRQTGMHGTPTFFNILVVVGAYYVTPKCRHAVEEFAHKQMIMYIAIDEVHTCLYNITWQSYVRHIARFRLKSTPLIGLTGTLPKKWTEPLAHFIGSKAGSVSSASIHAVKGRLVCSETNESEKRQLATDWFETKGIYRKECTVNSNIRHGVIDAGNASDEDLKQKVVDFVGARVESNVWNCVQVFASSRQEVEDIHQLLEARLCSQETPSDSLVGGEPSEVFLQKWTSGETKVVVTSTIGSMGWNNPYLDASVQLCTYFGPLELIQMGYRAGRQGQPADSVFIHSKRREIKMAKFDDGAQIKAILRGAGVDSANVDLLRCLMNERTSDIIGNGCSCRLAAIKELLDDDSNPDLCGKCDLCDSQYKRKLQHDWAVASSEIRPGLHCDDVVDVLSEESQATEDPTLNPALRESRMLLDDPRSQLMIQVQQFLKTLGSNRRCHWHKEHHDESQEASDFLFVCRRAWACFLGLPSDVDPCCQCGDDARQCREQGCLRRMDSIIRKHASLVHTRCGIPCNIDGVETHQRSCSEDSEEDCPCDKAWGLVPWAFRSSSGNAAVKEYWPGPKDEYPDRVPFAHEMEGEVQSYRKDKWEQAMSWLSIPENSVWFWIAVMKAVKVFE